MVKVKAIQLQKWEYFFIIDSNLKMRKLMLRNVKGFAQNYLLS